MKGWLCELCYAYWPGDKFPESWDVVWQSPICPTRKERAAFEGKAIATLLCGCWADGRKDPRPSPFLTEDKP